MALIGFKKKVLDPADSGEVEKCRRAIRRSPTVAMGVKVLPWKGWRRRDSLGVSM